MSNEPKYSKKDNRSGGYHYRLSRQESESAMNYYRYGDYCYVYAKIGGKRPRQGGRRTMPMPVGLLCLAFVLVFMAVTGMILGRNTTPVPGDGTAEGLEMPTPQPTPMELAVNLDIDPSHAEAIGVRTLYG